MLSNQFKHTPAPSQMRPTPLSLRNDGEIVLGTAQIGPLSNPKSPEAIVPHTVENVFPPEGALCEPLPNTETLFFCLKMALGDRHIFSILLSRFPVGGFPGPVNLKLAPTSAKGAAQGALMEFGPWGRSTFTVIIARKPHTGRTN